MVKKYMTSVFDSLYLDHWAAHLSAVVALISSLLGIFPAVAGMLACLYYFIQVYESDTVKQTLKRWRARRLAARIAKLKQAEDQLRLDMKRLGFKEED